MGGGKRQGAGRPKGSKDRTSRAERLTITKEIVRRAEASGILPLDVMLTAMRAAWDESDKDKAVQYAEKAAPYMHARLAAVQHSGDKDNPVEHRQRIEMVLIDAATDAAISADDASLHTEEARSTH